MKKGKYWHWIKIIYFQEINTWHIIAMRQSIDIAYTFLCEDLKNTYYYFKYLKLYI